jgi:hypothetical protein
MTPDIALKIWENRAMDYDMGGRNIRDIAAKYGVTHRQVYSIYQGGTWNAITKLPPLPWRKTATRESGGQVPQPMDEDDADVDADGETDAATINAPKIVFMQRYIYTAAPGPQDPWNVINVTTPEKAGIGDFFGGTPSGCPEDGQAGEGGGAG